MLSGSIVTISGSPRLYEIHGDAVINHLTDTDDLTKTQSIVNLPRAQAGRKDYEINRTTGPCFPGTREALLREMMDWAIDSSESRMYLLSGLAGIGKSTVVYTVATQADDLGLLGASFFFSRDDADRRSAKKFFTTIAYQLCLFNEEFAQAIVGALGSGHGSTATTGSPQEQLQALILDPLRAIVTPNTPQTLIVVDALDECDDEDARFVLSGLRQLIQALPSFKVILTTRLQPLVNNLDFTSQGVNKIFHLQDIEDKVVNDDIRLYLRHCLSREQVRVQLPQLTMEWCASDAQIESLVDAAGKLFIIASTAVRYILDKLWAAPASRMKTLLDALAKGRSPFKNLSNFYTVILHSAVPTDCDDEDLVERYQTIVGTIVLSQVPLSVDTLANLIGVEMEHIFAVLCQLQSVILLGNDNKPRIYHKSFSDYITDSTRCCDVSLYIDARNRHTQIAVHCFLTIDQLAKVNILGLGDPARFMSNEDGLREDKIADEQLQEKIPQQLRYAGVYWANHLKVSNIEDAVLIKQLEKFADERMLPWFEVLSLIGKLDSAHLAIGTALKLLKSTFSDVPVLQLLSDGLRFISKFYEIIKRSALHTYYSALPFTPTNSLLYRRYIKCAVNNVCAVDDGPDKWSALIANLNHGSYAKVIKFSLDSALFVSCSEGGYLDIRHEECVKGVLRVWDSATGTPISMMIPGDKLAVADDFSTIASSEGGIVTFYNIDGSARDARFTASLDINELALSSESNRVAAALSDGTVLLWDSGNAELINSLDGFKKAYAHGYFPHPQLRFSATGTRLAYLSANGIVKLWNAINGKFIADLQCASVRDCEFLFSDDGSCIVSQSMDRGLILWNSESGELVGVRYDNDVRLVYIAISTNGSLLATASYDNVKLWSEGHHNSLVKNQDIQLAKNPVPPKLAFSSNNILAIATLDGVVRLYNVQTHSFIATLPFISGRTLLAFSPDCTHLAAGSETGRMYLWNIQGFESSNLPSQEQPTRVTALALSRDCSRLACGFDSGTIELWGIGHAKQRIALHQAHVKPVWILKFGPDGGLFASGSTDETIKLWNGRDGTLRGTLRTPGWLVAISNNMLAVRNANFTLWTLDTLSHHHTFGDHEITGSLSFSDDSTLAASVVSVSVNAADIIWSGPQTYYPRRLHLIDIVNCRTVATFNLLHDISTVTFLRDNSQLVVQCFGGELYSVNLNNKQLVKGPIREYLVQLPNFPRWYGVPIWHCIGDGEQHYLAALFPLHKDPVPVLWIPKDLRVEGRDEGLPREGWAQGLSMVALRCENGQVILVRPPTRHVR